MSIQATIPISPFPDKGFIKAFSVPKLFRTLYQHQATGSLYVLTEQTKKIVFFVHGMPVFVRSNRVSECLGQILADEGLITQKQCDHTLEAIRRTGRKQGELFVEMGILSPGNIRYGLEAQLRRKLFDIFTWTEGRFQFSPGQPQVPHIHCFHNLIAHVIVWGVKTSFSAELAVEGLSTVLDQFPVKSSEEEESINALALSPEKLNFFMHLDASKSIRELLDTAALDSMHSPLPWVAPLLLGLIEAEMVELKAERSHIRTPSPSPLHTEKHAFTLEELKPNFAQVSSITEYEDTPLPQHIHRLTTRVSTSPHLSSLSQEDEDMFAKANLLTDEQTYEPDFIQPGQSEFLTDDLFASINGEISERSSNVEKPDDAFSLGEMDEDLLIYSETLLGIQEIEIDDEFLQELQSIPLNSTSRPQSLNDENEDNFA